MDLNARSTHVVRVIVFVFVQLYAIASANVVFHVQHKYATNKTSLNAFKNHDTNRHRRFLSAVELPLGGDGSPTSVALYYTKIKLGSPPKDFYVQVDTGSDILWVNSVECENCPTESGLGLRHEALVATDSMPPLLPQVVAKGITANARSSCSVPLTFFDPKGSSSAKVVGCDDEFCKKTFDGPSDECKPGMLCAYSMTYGDGSSTAGFFVNDNVTLAQVTGDNLTTSMSGNAIFGCAAKASGGLVSSEQALDGIIGFGQSNTSLLSQLASAKMLKKVFSHCLDGNKGGGIFTIGEVVEPQVKTTPILEDHTHFNVALESIDVNGDVIKLESDFTEKLPAIVDSGTTLTYLPDAIYTPLMEKIIAAQPDNQPQTVEKLFKCYMFTGNVDDGFPVVNFNFENSLPLKVMPHQYFFEVEKNAYCIGFQNSNFQSKNGDGLILLGDLVLSDKLVTYDMEKQAIGWIDYNCSSSIKVKDEQSGNIYEVYAQDISSAYCTCNSRMVLGLLLSLAATFLII